MSVPSYLACRPEDVVFLDTETTSLEGEIVEIACLSGTGEVLLDTLVWPSTPIPAEATAIHRISAESFPPPDQREGVMWSRVYPLVREIISGKTVIAYNAIFDRKMLHRSCEAWGVGPHDDLANLPSGGWVCLMKSYQDWTGVRPYQSLASVAEVLGVSRGPQTHRALDDCRLAREVWLKMRSSPRPAAPKPLSSLILFRNAEGQVRLVAELPHDAPLEAYLAYLPQFCAEATSLRGLIELLELRGRGWFVQPASPDAWKNFHRFVLG